MPSKSDHHSRCGLAAVMTVEGGTDQQVFLTYLDKVLLPALDEGDLLVLDNLAAHRVEAVRRTVEAAGCQLVFQPPYSPDVNPIEMAWSKLKAFLRTARARTREALDTAIRWAMELITPDDAYGWFTHCGVETQEP